MEESKDLQTLYKVFRTFIYVSLFVEFFEYAVRPEVLDFWGGILADIHARIKLMDVYQDGHLLRSKVMTLLIICVTCIGTRNKKHPDVCINGDDLFRTGVVIGVKIPTGSR